LIQYDSAAHDYSNKNASQKRLRGAAKFNDAASKATQKQFIAAPPKSHAERSEIQWCITKKRWTTVRNSSTSHPKRRETERKSLTYHQKRGEAKRNPST
jgi:hypothetical protein